MSEKTPVFLLLATSAQIGHLLNTIEAFNRGAQYVGAQALAHDRISKVDIQPLVYPTLRGQYGLSSQMAVRAISVGVETSKSHLATFCSQWRSRRNRQLAQAASTTLPSIPIHSPVPYDDQLVSFPDVHTTSIRTLHGREKIPMHFCYYCTPVDNYPFTRLIFDEEWGVFFVHLPSSDVAIGIYG